MSEAFCPPDDRAASAAPWDDMADYEIPRFSKREIVAAGRALAGTITTADSAALEVFRIAHNWRSAHVYPMRRLRMELTRTARKVHGGAITAARLKRMSSIRRKMRTTNLTLYQLQDIGGCRVVFESTAEVERLLALYRAGASRHTVNREWDYITNPKPDGYRSIHLVFKFNGEDREAVYNRQTIEMQIRTKLQHSWATAVEVTLPLGINPG